MLGDDEINDLQEEIKMLEEQLRERKRTLTEAKYAGIRAAMKARQEADQMLNEELKALGIRRMSWPQFI